MKDKTLTIIGAPSSAGAYSPGQEKAPDALRQAGLIRFLEAGDMKVADKNNVPGFRWKADQENPRAMNKDKVAEVATALSQKVYESLQNDEKILVLGGDCSIELGTVAGSLQRSENIGLLYIDLDTDLTTPQSTQDGAFDWMGVAHLLNIQGCEQKLASLGKRVPMLNPEQIHFYGNGNVIDSEREIIQKHKIRETPLQDVAADPAGTAKKIRESWAPQFDHLLIHLDVDVLNFVDMPLAENTRRHLGLTFEQLMVSLNEFLKAPNWSVLTITEINPDHGESDTLRIFVERLARAISAGYER